MSRSRPTGEPDASISTALLNSHSPSAPVAHIASQALGNYDPAHSCGPSMATRPPSRIDAPEGAQTCRSSDGLSGTAALMRHVIASSRCRSSGPSHMPSAGSAGTMAGLRLRAALPHRCRLCPHGHDPHHASAARRTALSNNPILINSLLYIKSNIYRTIRLFDNQNPT